jgi:hypothetical protein
MTATKGTNLMLETLDTIDWTNLEHAYGRASDVPETLRMLASPDPKIREKGYYTVYGNIFHQGTRYEATAYAVPFLYEMLREPNTPERGQLVSLLVSLAMGYENEFLPFGFDPAEYFSFLNTPETQGKMECARELGIFYGDEDDDDEEDGLSYEEREELYEVKLGFAIRDTYRAVENGVPDIIALLDDPDAEVRIQAAHALAWFPERTTDSLPALRRAYGNASTPHERANILPALGILARAAGDKSDIELLTSLLDEGQPNIVRQTAAIALTTLLEAETPADALAILMEASADERDESEEETATKAGEENKEDSEALPWNEGDLPGYAGMVLQAAAEGREAEIVTALCTALRTGPAMRSLSLTGVLLHLVFGGAWEGKTAADLTPLQRQALEAIAEYGAWTIAFEEMPYGMPESAGSIPPHGDFGNYRILMSNYALPSSRDELQALLNS